MFADPQGEHASSTRFSCHLTQIEDDEVLAALDAAAPR